MPPYLALLCSFLYSALEFPGGAEQIEFGIIVSANTEIEQSSHLRRGVLLVAQALRLGA